MNSVGLFGSNDMSPTHLVLARSQILVVSLLAYLLDIYSLLIIARVIVSWIGLSPMNQAVRLIQSLTDPILVPIQNVIPPIGGTIDVSPLIAFVFIRILRAVIIRAF